MAKGRYKIGFLDDNQNDDFHSQILIGIFKAAQELDIEMIRFGYYSSHIAYKFSHQANMVLDHIEQYDLDGLIFLGWTRAGAMYNYDGFTARFRGVPLLSIGTEFEGIPSVIFRGNEYIRELLHHLINGHKMRKIAYIEHYRPDNRYEHYISTMKEHSLYDPMLYVGYDKLKDYSLQERMKRALEVLMDERGIIPEAIMTLVNVDTVNLLHELELRGFSVPRDIAVTSYEDSELAIYFSPGLTTIYFPWMELGYNACVKMAELLDHGKIPMCSVVEGKIIYRASCGCQPDHVKAADTGKIIPAGTVLKTASASDRAGIAQEITLELERTFPGLGFDYRRLVDSFAKNIDSGSDRLFLNEFSNQLGKLKKPDFNEASNHLELVSAFRKSTLPYIINDEAALLLSNDIFLQAQSMLSEKAAELSSLEKVNAKVLDHTLQEISQSLVSSFSIHHLVDSVEKCLPKLGIPSCYIFVSNSLFSEETMETNLFENCILVFEYSGRVRRESRTNKPSSARKILADILSVRNGPSNLLAYMLHVTDEIIGFALFEAGPADERIYHALSTHISTALRGATLLNRLDSSYKILVDHAQREGMADIAAEILHNIGNILNSISVSVHIMEEAARSSAFEDMVRANGLLEQNMHDLKHFMQRDAKGKKLMHFYMKLGEAVKKLQIQLVYNSDRLCAKVGAINEIVTAQQNYAGVDAAPERISLETVLEDAIKVNSVSLERYRVEVLRDYREKPQIWAQRAKLFYILVNLINNAREAMEGTPADGRQLKVTLCGDKEGKCIKICDTGCGIPMETIDGIFGYGFSTKTGRHGFGLYSSASYMAEMGGSLTAESEGPGRGATFTLRF